jgi:Undecaprenyl-phosphate glucose phosphotransferase
MNFVQGRVRVPEPTRTAQAVPPHERKWPVSYQSIESLAISADVFIIFLSSILAGVIYYYVTFGISGDLLQYIGSAAVVAALFVSLGVGRNLYDPAELLDLKTQLHGVAATWIGVFLFFAGVVFALKIGTEFSRGIALSFATTGLVLLLVQRILWSYVLAYGLRRHKFSGRQVVIIAEDAACSELFETLIRHGFEPREQFTLPTKPPFRDRDDEVSDIIAYLRESPSIDEIVVSAELDHCSDLIRRLARLRELPITVSFVPVGASAKILKRPSRQLGENTCIELQRKPLDSLELGIKRLMDVVCASIGLIALLPLLLLTALAIRLDSPGPILFRQRRCGFNGEEFHILKFRTMSVMEDGQKILQAGRQDSRVTRVGKWLRRTSIDELPQLLNVLSGSMSLVGPRPHALAHDSEFDKTVRNYALRHHVKPGVTGWAQVNGCRGSTPTVADIRRRVDLDLWYIDHWSITLDCVIIVRTVIEILRGRNAY